MFDNRQKYSLKIFGDNECDVYSGGHHNLQLLIVNNFLAFFQLPDWKIFELSISLCADLRRLKSIVNKAC